MAYLTAVSIKLNFEPATGPQREQRLRRRLWWSCYTQCCLSNIDAKSRSQITLSEGQINPPIFDDFAQDLTLNLIPESFDPSFSVKSSAFGFIERVKLLRIYNEIISTAKPRQGHDLVAPAISTNIENIIQSVTRPKLRDDVLPSCEMFCDNEEFLSEELNAERHIEGFLEEEFETTAMLLNFERVLYNGC